MKMQCTNFGNDVNFSSSRVLKSDNCKQSITVRFFINNVFNARYGLPMEKLSYNDKLLVGPTKL